MPSSTEFKELSRAIARVKRHFVVRSSLTAVGPFADRVYDRARALRVLACAEFERYFEDRAYSIAKRAVNYQLRAPANEIVCSSLVASHLIGFILNGDEPPRRKVAESFFAKSHMDFRASSLKSYEEWLKNNNGVRDENLENILRPIGFDLGRFDPLFLTEITQFAKQRGEIAHKGVCVAMLINPSDEFAKIDRILGMIKVADPLLEIPVL